MDTERLTLLQNGSDVFLLYISFWSRLLVIQSKKLEGLSSVSCHPNRTLPELGSSSSLSNTTLLTLTQLLKSTSYHTHTKQM